MQTDKGVIIVRENAQDKPANTKFLEWSAVTPNTPLVIPDSIKEKFTAAATNGAITLAELEADLITMFNFRVKEKAGTVTQTTAPVYVVGTCAPDARDPLKVKVTEISKLME